MAISGYLNMTYNPYMAIHSADHIPDYPDGFFTMKPNITHIVKYWPIEWKLMKSPYNNHCDDYSDDAEYMSNYDCLTQCHLREMRKVNKYCLNVEWITRLDKFIENDTLCQLMAFHHAYYMNETNNNDDETEGNQ